MQVFVYYSVYFEYLMNVLHFLNFFILLLTENRLHNIIYIVFMKGQILMNFHDKIEILLHRKGYKKTEFADKLGITYRALANYLAGARKPKSSILQKITKELGVSEDFLFDDGKNLVLNSEERFLYGASKDSVEIDKAMDLLEQARVLLAGDGLTSEDKREMYSCFTEIYFDEVNKSKG